jgi:hypothetical protein
MRAAPWIVAAPWVAAAVMVVTLAGCSGGAVIKPTIASGSPFCNHVSTFATQVAALNDAAAESQTTLLQLLAPIESTLKSLESEAPATDTVNGKSLKTDIGTMARVYDDLINELQKTSDVKAALSTVNAKDGQALTDAVGRFDDYSSSVCKVNQAVPGLSSSTTGGPSSPSTTAGPTAPTT